MIYKAIYKDKKRQKREKNLHAESNSKLHCKPGFLSDTKSNV